MKIDRDKPCEWYSWRETRRMIAEGELPWRFALHSLAPLPLECCFWFQGRESFAFSIWSQKSHIHPTFLCLCFLSAFLSLSLTRMPLLAGGFICFMPQREPSCTDVLPGLQFLAFAWSSHPSRTTGPDEELWRLHLAASHSTWGFCPQTSPPPHHPECSFETREAVRRGNPSSLWPRALRLTLAPKWKNVHSTTRARWCRDLPLHRPLKN